MEPIVVIDVNITLLTCPPGPYLSKGVCVCSHESDDEGYLVGLDCVAYENTNLIVMLQSDYWFGYMHMCHWNDTPTTCIQQLYTGILYSNFLVSTKDRRG